MKFKEREVRFPKRKKVTKLNAEFEEIEGTEEFFNIESCDELNDIIEPGTVIDAEVLNKGNWRDDTTLSFKALNLDNKPESKVDETQIYTNSKGTFLMPPGNKEEIELGKTTGTTVFDSNKEDGWEKWNADTKQDLLTSQQLQNIADVVNKQDKLTEQQLQNIADVVNKQDKLTEQQLQNIADVPNKEPVISKNTAFNKGFATTNPQMNGTATAGTSDDVAHGNHVHPSDATKADKDFDNTDMIDWIVESGTGTFTANSRTGHTWWRKWKSGRLEQGGIWENGTQIRDAIGIEYSFSKAYSHNNFTCVATHYRSSNNTANRGGYTTLVNKTATSLHLGWYGPATNDTFLGITWYCTD